MEALSMRSFFSKCVTTVLALGLMGTAGNAVANGDGHHSYWDCAIEAPCAQPCGGCDSDCGFFIVSDLFYWQTCNTRKDFALTSSAASPIGASVTSQLHYNDYDWEFGFRLGAGYRMPWDCWDARFVWTYFHTDGKNSASEPSGGALFITYGFPGVAGGTVTAETAAIRHDIDYDSLDFVMGRPHFVSKTLLMRPYTGLRFMWMDQKQVLTLGTGAPWTGSHDGYTWASDYTAVGLVCGSDVRIHICGPFSLYGSCACGVLAGDADNHYTATVADAVVLNITENEDCLCSTFKEARVGISWEGEFCGCGCVMFDLSYEFTHYDNVPAMRRYYELNSALSSSGAEGQLGFHGFTLSTRYDF